MPTAEEKRFFTTKPRSIYYETIELYHSQIGVLRYVARQYSDVSLTLEAGAPRNADEPVVFTPAAMQITPLTQSDNPVAGINISLGRVGQNVKEEILKISGAGFFEQIEMIYRVYNGDVVSSPLNVPVKLFISGVTMEADGVAFVAEDDNPGGVTVARKYLPQDFPGLGTSL